jgi:hypothetical protein
MMDDETKQYLDQMMVQINNQFERVLNRIDLLERDFANSKGFLIGDALIQGSRWFDLEARVTKLENKQ